MPLPPRPPTPLIQVSSLVPSELHFKSPDCTVRCPTQQPSLNEFDPVLLREHILRDAILKHQLRIDKLSIICGEPGIKCPDKKSGISLSIGLDLPSPITRSILGIPSPSSGTDPVGFHFFVMALSTVFVFLLMTYIYVKGFVSSR